MWNTYITCTMPIRIVLIFTVFSWGYNQEYWNNVDDFEVLAKISLTHVDEPQQVVPEKHQVVIYFDYNTTLEFICVNHSPYSKNTKITIHGENNVTFIDAPSNTFKATGKNHRHFRLTKYSDGTFSGFWQSEEGQWLFLDALERHLPFMHPHHKSMIGNGTHLLLRESNVPVESSKRGPATGAKAPLSPPPDTCPMEIHEVTLSVAITVAYFRAHGTIEKAAGFIVEAIMALNVWFELDVKLHLTIQNAVIYTTGGKVTWNKERGVNGCEDPTDQFKVSWYNEIPQCCGTTVLGLLFHNCGTFSTISSAGQLCSKPAFTMSSHPAINTRRAIGWGIGIAIGVPNEDDGLMGPETTDPYIFKYL